MIDEKYFWISQTVLLVVMAFIFYRIYNLFVRSKDLSKMIQDHFSAQNLIIESISKLNTTERLKYGEPPIGIYRIYNYYFGIFSGKIEYTRKVEVIDSDKNELTKYVELEVRNKKLTRINEFDSYDI